MTFDFDFVCAFETVSYYIVQDGLKLVIFLSQLPGVER